MEIIVTGFDPFGEYSSNPSADAMNLLLDYVVTDDERSRIPVAKKVLPTCCSDSWQQLEQLVGERQSKPFLLLITGFADRADKIELERFALNTRQYRIPDNNKHTHQDEYLDPSAPEAYRTKLPLTQLEAELAQSGYLCKISNFAGTFICNEIYFRSMQKWHENPNCVGVLFVHVPPPEKHQEARAKAELPELDSLQCYADCLTAIGKFAYKNLNKEA